MADLRTELLRIRAKRGDLTPRIVMEEARPANHPLHNRVYDVGRKEAADRYYLSNAARLLRVTFREDVDGRPADLRAFWVVQTVGEHPHGSYTPMEEVIADPIQRNLMLRSMLREWNRFKARYKVHAEFTEMVLNDPDLFPINPDESFGEDDDGDGTDG